MIRDPVERAVSHHLMLVREGWETRSLEQAVDDELREEAPWAHAYLRNGRYHDDIKRYLDAFGDRVLVVVLEDFVRDVAAGMAPVWEFLGLAPVDLGEARAVNAHTVPRNRVVATAMRRRGLDGGQEAAAERDPAPGTRRNARPCRETGGRGRPPPPSGGLLRRRHGGDRASAGAQVAVERATCAGAVPPP